MAPEPTVLKRQRSRPSEWWAASPSTTIQHAITPPAAQPSKKAIIKSNILETVNSSKLAPAKKTIEKKPIEKALSNPGSAPDTPQNTERASLKRKRARPSEWWAANPVVQPGEPPLLQHSSRKASQKLKEGAGKPLAAGTEATQSEKASRKPGEKLNEATSTPKQSQYSPTDYHLKKTSQKLGTTVASSNAALEDTRSRISKRKRTRPSNWWAANPSTAVQENESTGSTAGKAAKAKHPNQILKDVSSRGNQVKGTNSIETGKGTSKPKATEEEPRGRLRTRQSDVRIEELAPSVNLANEQPRGKRQHGSGEVLEVQTASSTFGRDRTKRDNRVETVVESPKGEASQSVASRKGSKIAKSQTSQPPSKSVSKSHSKKAARVSETNASQKKRKAENKVVEPSWVAKRSRVSEVSQEDGDEEEELPQYQHLVETTRKVNRTTIEKTWEGLPPGAVELVSQLLNDTQRPVVVRIGDKNKRAQATTALQMISRRLMSKVSKGLPFPKGIGSQREHDFNFEKIIDRNRMLESQLTTEVDAKKLLEDNLNQELSRLEAERAILTELEANAKTESALRKEAERKMHPLLQSAGSPEAEDLEDSSNLRVSLVLPSLGVSIDEDLQTVVRDLEGHVESLQSNLKPLSGLPEAMAKAKAAVQITLFDHLESDRYGEVVLGPEGASSN